MDDLSLYGEIERWSEDVHRFVPRAATQLANMTEHVEAGRYWFGLEQLDCYDVTCLALVLGSEAAGILGDFAPLVERVVVAKGKRLAYRRERGELLVEHSSGGNSLPAYLVPIIELVNALECVGVRMSADVRAVIRTWIEDVEAETEYLGAEGDDGGEGWRAVKNVAVHNKILAALAIGPRDLEPNEAPDSPIYNRPGETLGLGFRRLVTDAPPQFAFAPGSPAPPLWQMEDVCRYFATAARQEAAADDVAGLYYDVLRSYPSLKDAWQLDDASLLWLGRMFHHRFEGCELGDVANALHQCLWDLAEEEAEEQER
jgi:hypothetical protein